jgi:hypothetical protein
VGDRSASHERFIRSADALWRNLPDGVLLLSPALEQPIAIIGSTAGVWSLLEHPRTLDGLALELAGRHGIDAAEVRGDVEATLRELHSHSLVKPVGPDWSPRVAPP